MWQKIKSLVTNKVIIYLLSRYFTYLLQFINSLFIAVYLGPFYLGVWGFITLCLQYIGQVNFGIPYSVNAYLAIFKNKDKYIRLIVGVSVFMTLVLSLAYFLWGFGTYFFNIDIGEKYNFNKYLFSVILIGIIGHFNTLFNNIFRVYGKIFEIAFNQTSTPVFISVSLLVFKKEDLLIGLLAANLLSYLLSLILYIVRTPVVIKPIISWRLIKKIQVKGWYLFIYNASFYLIAISTRTFVSQYFEVEDFGYFTFAFSLSNVVLLLIQSFSFLIFPKVINRFSKADDGKIIDIISNLRDSYVTTSHFLLHIAIAAYPIFLVFFPDYTSSGRVFSLLTLSVILYTNSFGYTSLLISKGKDKLLGRIALFALILNVVLSYIVIVFLSWAYSYIVITTILVNILFIVITTFYGGKLTGNRSFWQILMGHIIPTRILIPYLVSFSIVLLTDRFEYLVIPLILFVVMNYKILIKLTGTILNIIKDSKMIDI